MSRLLLIIYSAFLIFVSYISSRFPHNELNWFMTASPHWDNVRVGLALGLLLYAATEYFRVWPIRLLLGLSALLMGAIGVAGLYAETFLGLVDLNLRLLDIFILVEGGVFGLMASLEYYPEIRFLRAPEPAPQPMYTVSLFFLDRPPERSVKIGLPFLGA